MASERSTPGLAGKLPSGTRRVGALVVVLVACVVSAQVGTSAVNVALPELVEWSGRGFGAAQWVVVAYLLGMTGASLVIGYAGDVIGRAKTLRIGLAVFVAAGIACAVAPDLWVLVLARGVQGIGAAAMSTLPIALVRDAVADRRSGSVMGLLGTASAIGTAAGPALGGLLQGAWGWPAIFCAMIPLPLIVLAIPRVFADATAAGEGVSAAAGVRRFDFTGSVIVGVAAATYAIAFTGEVFGTWWSLGLMVVAGLLVTLLVPVERRATHPVMPGLLLRTRAVGLGAIVNLVVGAVMMSTLIVGPFYLAGAIGLSPTSVGLAMAAGPIVSIFSGMLAGHLVDRGSPVRLASAGLGVMAAGATALAVLPPYWGLPGYLIGTMLLAPGYQLFLASNNTLVMGAVTAERRGTASGLLGISRNLGLVTGTTILGSVFVAAIGSADAASASTDGLDTGLRLVFGIAAVALAGAALASVMLQREKR
ncbi:MAG: MFS transporter [Microbacterium sp.]